MKTERIEVFGISVGNLDEAVALFPDLFGVRFHAFSFGEDVEVKVGPVDATDLAPLGVGKTRIAIDSTGFFELIESDPAVGQIGFHNIHFKVDDIEQSKIEMRKRGIRLIVDIAVWRAARSHLSSGRFAWDPRVPRPIRRAKHGGSSPAAQKECARTNARGAMNPCCLMSSPCSTKRLANLPPSRSDLPVSRI